MGRGAMPDMGPFLRPIAHRGLHDRSAAIEENTCAAFEAAIVAGLGIECDVRPARDGLPVVFHDETLARIVGTDDAVENLNANAIATLRTRVGSRPIPTLDDLLALVAGRVPLLIEIKSDWTPPRLDFLRRIAASCLEYRGPVALMSFDPDVMTVLRELAPQIPRGIVSGRYYDTDGRRWWADHIDAERAERLANLLESGPADVSFYAYDVSALPTPVTRYVRAVDRLPLFTWTVRTSADWSIAHAHADAPIFEKPASAD